MHEPSEKHMNASRDSPGLSVMVDPVGNFEACAQSTSLNPGTGMSHDGDVARRSML